jgi:hypothetical protein
MMKTFKKGNFILFTNIKNFNFFKKRNFNFKISFKLDYEINFK